MATSRKSCKFILAVLFVLALDYFPLFFLDLEYTLTPHVPFFFQESLVASAKNTGEMLGASFVISFVLSLGQRCHFTTADSGQFGAGYGPTIFCKSH